MARAIAGGLIFSTLVSLLVLPTIYSLLDDMSLSSSASYVMRAAARLLQRLPRLTLQRRLGQRRQSPPLRHARSVLRARRPGGAVQTSRAATFRVPAPAPASPLRRAVAKTGA